MVWNRYLPINFKAYKISYKLKGKFKIFKYSSPNVLSNSSTFWLILYRTLIWWDTPLKRMRYRVNFFPLKKLMVNLFPMERSSDIRGTPRPGASSWGTYCGCGGIPSPTFSSAAQLTRRCGCGKYLAVGTITPVKYTVPVPTVVSLLPHTVPHVNTYGTTITLFIL